MALVAKALPSQEELNQLLLYDPDTGLFFWKPRSDGRINARCFGRPAGRNGRGGYRELSIRNSIFSAHRVAWKYVYGVDPQGMIDHINGDRKDNRIANLRDVSRSLNARNSRLFSHNKSGVAGVCWVSARSHWMVTIKVDQKVHYLGRYRDKQEAIAARKTAEARFGFHPNHGRSGLPPLGAVHGTH